MKIKLKLKIAIDITLLISIIVSAVTGIILLVSPSGPGTRAGLESSSIFDLSYRSSLKLFHDWSSILFLALIVFHLLLNVRTITCYFKASFRALRGNGCEKI